MVSISVVLLLKLVDVREFITIMREANWGVILLAVFFLVLSYWLISLRWRYLLSNEPGIIQSFHIVGSGSMLGILMQLPNSPYRVVTVDRSTSLETSEATLSTVVDVLTGHISRILALAVGFVFLASELRGEEGSLFIGIGVVVLLIGGLFVLVSRAAVDGCRPGDGVCGGLSSHSACCISSYRSLGFMPTGRQPGGADERYPQAASEQRLRAQYGTPPRCQIALEPI